MKQLKNCRFDFHHVGEFYREFSGHFSFLWHWTILMPNLHEDHICCCAYITKNLSEQEMLQIQVLEKDETQYTTSTVFPKCYCFQDNWTECSTYISIFPYSTLTMASQSHLKLGLSMFFNYPCIFSPFINTCSGVYCTQKLTVLKSIIIDKLPYSLNIKCIVV
jgi:hypothetical protein